MKYINLIAVFISLFGMFKGMHDSVSIALMFYIAFVVTLINTVIIRWINECG